jgi:hypothetical protein
MRSFFNAISITKWPNLWWKGDWKQKHHAPESHGSTLQQVCMRASTSSVCDIALVEEVRAALQPQVCGASAFGALNISFLPGMHDHALRLPSSAVLGMSYLA